MKKGFTLRFVPLAFALILPILGSAQNTLELMKDLLPGIESSTPQSLTAFKNKIYFFATTDPSFFGRSLCASDGTPDGTKEILPLPVSTLGLPDGLPVVIGDTLYFFTKTNDFRFTVWASDGTMAGTNPLFTTMPYEWPSGGVTVFKGNLWFGFGNKIRYFDTDQNALIDFHTAESGIENLSSTNDYIYWFSLHPISPYSSENYFYRSNDQPGNVQFLENVGSSSNSTSGSTHIEKITRYENGRFRWHTLGVSYYNGGTYYFGGRAGIDSTNIFMTTWPMSILASALTDSIYFLYTIDNYGASVPPYPSNWQLLAASSGGSFQRVMADTAQIIGESVQAHKSSLFVATPKHIFFRVWKSDTHTELGTSDGSIAGTKLVKDINPGPNQSYIRNFTLCGDNVLFSAFDGNEYGIWYSDGTESGTQKLASMPNGYESYNNQFSLVVGDALYIDIYTNSRGRELWKLSPVPCSGVSQSGEPQKHLNFRLSPNPSLAGNTHLFLNESIKPPFQLRLSVMTGNILWQKQIKYPIAEIEIPTDFLAAGIYFVTLEKEGGSMTKKLMLMR